MGKDMDSGSDSSLKAVQDLNDLMVKRSSIKGQITKFKNFLTQLTAKETLNAIELSELTLRLNRFELLPNKFDDLQSQIEVLNSTNLSAEIDERDGVDQLFITNLATAKHLLQKFQPCSQHDESQYKDLNSSQVSFTQAENFNISYKLPELQIHRFDGSRWLEFRDMYLSIVHNNDRIAPIHKFHYLISYLTGDAARVISNLEVSNANYSNAWKLLCDRYDNKRQLINHHLNSLLNVQTISRESEKSLRFLVDHVTKNLRALSSLGQPTSHWDVLVIHLMSSKLDNNTRIKWEEWRTTLDDVPNLQNFYKFLTSRADVLESISRNSTTNKSSWGAPNTAVTKHDRPSTKSFTTGTSDVNTSTYYSCVICHGEHRIYDCPSFKALNVEERLAKVHKLKLCVNCLRSTHTIKDCRIGPCRICKARHNTLLHKPKVSGTVATSSVNTDSTLVNFSNKNSKLVLLSTAIIEVTNPITNQSEKVRALLDCGSQSSFITAALKAKLGLQSNSNLAINVIGVGNNPTEIVKESCVAQLRSLYKHFNVTSTFLVLPALTGYLPISSINLQQHVINIPDDVQLADPTFHQPAPIDVLIGADIFWDILGHEQRSLGPKTPQLRSSKLGWIISGPIYDNNSNNAINKVHCNHSIFCDSASPIDINQELTKFWELEEVPLKSKLSPSEKACEAHFLSHTFRLNSGRFSVGLPLKDSPECLGESYSLAKRRFLLLEKRFRKQPQVKLQYADFIREYATLGHLSESAVQNPHISYFLCHHPVFKDSSESTKLRVVFDGSASTSSGQSINDILLVGANLQDSLFSILVRARQHKYLLTGDIEKMYRQVQINEEDRDLQLILWREDESKPLQTLRLNTVTYGMASSSYLSTRCLWQLGEEWPDALIKTIIQHDFYIDDLITGADNEGELLHIQRSVTAALQQGCFNLRKFKSNSSSILDSASSGSNDNLIVSESSSTLGMGWETLTDTLHFPITVPVISHTNCLTKRKLLSTLFKIFDPLGLLSPCVILAKIILQQLWFHKLSWDDIVPDDVQKSWNKFCDALPSLLDIRIPRHAICDEPVSIELHSFSDASQRAYGASIYLRSTNALGQVTTSLLCSKSRVAPVKPTTIPRLELCAALLAAKLCVAVGESLRCEVTQYVHWCDSTVVLGWIHSSFKNLKTYVANRVSEICELTNPASWRYVPTLSNPADLISRGLAPDHLINNKMWWSGPSYLSEPETKWPVLKEVNMSDLPELKAVSTVTNVSIASTNLLIQFQNHSSLRLLKRSFAYVLRFAHNSKNPNNQLSGPLSPDELNNSFLQLCQLAQLESFPLEYDLLSRKKSLSLKSHLLSLSPFLSDERVIRVGGRLEASDYNFDKKHPVLLHASHCFTKLIFEHEHKANCHAGPLLLLATVREYVWPINGRHLARRTIQKCFKCRRMRPKPIEPMMAPLPSERIMPNFPFKTVGIDFAGPFFIVNKKGRGSKLLKCYLCLFICMRYKCLHLEAVSDMSKDAFIMTFRRFVSRRGRPTEVYCDNGRNFVAGAKEINNFFKTNSTSLSDFASEEGIKFNFSPAYAPHFGGIWEAGVKSAKFHIKRVIGNSHLTFEGITTLFAQVESILNSRPLCPLSSSPNDLLCLTPGHFIIGRPLTALPSPADIQDAAPQTTLQRYARLMQIHQHFWRRWQREYLSELQQRRKWKTNKTSLAIGDLVIIHEDDIPPLQWRLGRVTRLFPGPDGISRVADVHTVKGIIRRPLVRLCPLPTAEELQC